MNRFYNPVRTYQGHGSFAKAWEIVEEVSPRPKGILLVVWNEMVLTEATVADFLTQATCPVHTVIFEKANPTVEDLHQLYQDTKTLDYSLIVAIGGGSTLDVAKILGCIQPVELGDVDDLRTMLYEKTYPAQGCPWIGVPTTAGTGSEVTCWATIWDVTRGKKLSVEREGNYAKAAIVDPAFLKTMPRSLAVSSALDAVAHATESYWAKDSNPATRGLALYAISTVMNAMDALLQDGKNMDALSAMSQGSMLAGLAFSNTHTTACHSLSYPLTMHFQVPHGVAVSRLIGPMIAFNQDTIQEKTALFAAFGVTTGSEVQDKLNGILQQVGIPLGLRDWGVQVSDLDFLTDNAFTKGRIDNNPKVLTKEDVKQIFTMIF